MSLQFHDIIEGGCIAARGDEASMVAAIVTQLPQTCWPEYNIYIYMCYSNGLMAKDAIVTSQLTINYSHSVG